MLSSVKQGRGPPGWLGSSREARISGGHWSSVANFRSRSCSLRCSALSLTHCSRRSRASFRIAASVRAGFSVSAITAPALGTAILHLLERTCGAAVADAGALVSHIEFLRDGERDMDTAP